MGRGPTMTLREKGRVSKPAAVSDLISAHSRLLSRSIGSYMVDEIGHLSARNGGDYLMTLVELSITQATRPGGDAEADRQRSVSASAIGVSLGMPYETCRRKVRGLEAAGVCRRVTANRLAIVPEYMETPAYEADCAERWRNLRRYLVEFRELGFDLGQFSHLSPQTPVIAPTLNRTIGALIDDFILRLGEARIKNEEDTLNSNIISTLSVLNSDPIRRSRELMWKYPGNLDHSPYSLRQPATITMVARRLRLSEDIVSRRLNLYVRRGWIHRVPGGFMYNIDAQETPEANHSRNLMNLRFLQLVQAIRQLGIDPATVTVV